MLLRCDGEKDDLSKLLRVEWPEDTPSKDLWLLSLLLFDNDHSFVNTVHHQSNDICSRHSGKLLGDDVLQVDKITHILKCSKERQTIVKQQNKNVMVADLLVVADDEELDQTLFFFTFDFDISFTSAKASLKYK